MSSSRIQTINWDKVDTVLLDMDGTLLDLHFDTYFWTQYLPKKYSEIHAMPLHKITPEIHRLLKEKQGTLDWYCTGYWSRQFNLDIISAKNEIKHLVTERPQALEFLNILGTMGKRRILVTNADRASVKLKFSMTSIEPLLDLVISSHDYAVPKEKQQFWHQLQDNISFEPSRTVFIDDSESVLNAAKTYGIKALYGIAMPDSRQLHPSEMPFPVIEDFLHLLGPVNG